MLRTHHVLVSAPAVALALGMFACGADSESHGGSVPGAPGAGGADNDSFDDGSQLIGGGSGGGSSSSSTGGSYAAYGGSGGSSWGGGAGAWGGGGGANTNVSLGGSQDFGYFRALLASNQVPQPGDYDAAGFFAEHHTTLPPPTCGNRVCLQAMLGVMGNLLNGANCTMLQLGLNSPIAADPGSRPPLSLAVVVDTSGSMGDQNKIGFVRDGLGMLVDGLKDGDRFSLVTYDTDVEIPFQMQDVVGNRAAIRSIVEGLTANGGTNLYGGLEAGFREVAEHYDSGRQNRVILLSDGQPTAGITSEAQILSMSEGFNSDGVGLTTIGLGTSFNVELMRNLALQADGNFYFLESSAAVSEVFTEELSYFTVPIAFDLKLDVRAGTYYDFGVAHGSPFWTDTGGGGTLEVPSVFIAHRESAADAEQGRRGGGSALLLELMPKADDGSGTTEADVAHIDIQYREPGTNESISDSVTVNFPMPPWETPENGYFQAEDLSVVQKSFVMLNIYVGMDLAVKAFHLDGFATGAIAQIEALMAAVTDYNEEVQDEDIAADLALLQQLRDVMIANGVAEPEAVDIPEDPWPND